MKSYSGVTYSNQLDNICFKLVQYHSLYNDCVYKAVWTGFCLKIYFIFYVDFAFLAFIKCELYIPVQIQK